MFCKLESDCTDQTLVVKVLPMVRVPKQLSVRTQQHSDAPFCDVFCCNQVQKLAKFLRLQGDVEYFVSGSEPFSDPFVSLVITAVFFDELIETSSRHKCFEGSSQELSLKVSSKPYSLPLVELNQCIHRLCHFLLVRKHNKAVVFEAILCLVLIAKEVNNFMGCSCC